MNSLLSTCLLISFLVLPSLQINRNVASNVDDHKSTFSSSTSCSTQFAVYTENGVESHTESKRVQVDDNCDQYNKLTSNSPSNLTVFVTTCSHQKCGSNDTEEIPCEQYYNVKC